MAVSGQCVSCPKTFQFATAGQKPEKLCPLLAQFLYADHPGVSVNVKAFPILDTTACRIIPIGTTYI